MRSEVEEACARAWWVFSFSTSFPQILFSLGFLRYCPMILNKLCLQGWLVTPALSELVSCNARDISNLLAALKTLEGL